MHEMYAHGLLAPALSLVLWSLVMWLWLYATRIPAMQKAKIDPQEAALKRSLDLPARAMWPGDNYNHLMEQPTIFYATALGAQILGATDPVNIGLGWAYVTLRVVHSLVQATVNIVLLRFSIFTLASFALAALAIRVTLQMYALI